MKHTATRLPRQRIEKRLNAVLRRLHDASGAAVYAAQTCPAYYNPPILPVFSLVFDDGQAATSIRVVCDLGREGHAFRVYVFEQRQGGIQRCSDWINEQRANQFIDEALMHADLGDLGRCSWIHCGQNLHGQRELRDLRWASLDLSKSIETTPQLAS